MSTTSSTLDERLKELAAPLRDEVERRTAELVEIDATRDQLLAELRQLKGALDRLLPALKKTHKRGSTSNNGRLVSDERVAEIQRFVEEHKEFHDGFVAGPLARAINLSGDPVGKDTVRKAVLVMHDRGLVRAVRKTVGGGTLYKLVGQ